MKYWKKIIKKSWLFGDSEKWEPKFEDRGEVERSWNNEKKCFQARVCCRCRNLNRVGIKDGKSFLYCNTCREIME